MLAYLFHYSRSPSASCLIPGFHPSTRIALFFERRRPRRQIWIPFVLAGRVGCAADEIVYRYPLHRTTWLPFAWYAAVLWLAQGGRKDEVRSGDRRSPRPVRFSFI